VWREENLEGIAVGVISDLAGDHGHGEGEHTLNVISLRIRNLFLSQQSEHQQIPEWISSCGELNAVTASEPPLTSAKPNGVEKMKIA